MREYIFHSAVHGERWDNIAYKYYKNAYLIKPLINANPHVSSTILEESTIIKIPIDSEIIQENRSNLPLWKQ